MAIYANLLSKLCSEHIDLEESPETTEKAMELAEKINLKSFVGLYKFNSERYFTIKYDGNKLSEYDFNTITREIAEWGAMFGAPFLEALLQICSPLVKEDEIWLAYSDLLRKYTETSLTEYIPPVIERLRYTAPAPLGRIHVPRTIRLLVQGQVEYVSERVRVNIINLPVLFMVRFHGEMIRKLRLPMRRLSEYEQVESTHQWRVICQNVGYHSDFVSERTRARLLDVAFDVDFTDVKILGKVRKLSSTAPSVLDTTNLWEAFLGRRSLVSLITEILRAGYGLKPLCKLYELWCLRIILDTLSQTFGEYTPPSHLPGRFVFKKRTKGVRAEVYYNQSPGQSKLVKRLKRKGLGVSTRKRPDFTIRFSKGDKSTTLISDAKYRLSKNIGDDDVARLFWYLVDYGQVSDKHKLEGLFFHVSSSSEIHQCVRRENPQILVHLLSMKPSNIVNSKPMLRRLFSYLTGTI